MGKGITESFGLRLRKLRSGKGISQEELADRCGLHRTFIGRIERGESNITLTTLHKVAVGLGVRASALIDDRARP
jgi:transcriptional regulator with XRE-family HTH domain